MGMLAKFFDTGIIHIQWKYMAERNLPKKTKSKLIKKFGVMNFYFILEGIDFYYYWNLILMNEPPIADTTISINEN